MDLTLAATQQLLGLTSESPITTSGFGSQEDGDWIVGSVRTSLSGQGATIQISANQANWLILYWYLDS